MCRVTYEEGLIMAILTIKQFAEKHPAFPEGGLRWRIFHERTNGLKDAGAILRNGNRVLIYEERFFAWLDTKNGIDASASRTPAPDWMGR